MTTNVRKGRPSDRFVRLSQLRKLSACEQVAAVCYRVHDSRIEFLLVHTRGGGRWTFPKGSAERGLTHAQAAALEAFEEAGVHGRIEEACFARYYRQKDRGENRASKTGEKGIAVNAYLCEVLRLSPPQESKRDRTWFSVEDARQRLQEGREKEGREKEGRKNNGGAGIVRVLDRAVARIQQLRGTIGIPDRPQQRDRPRLGQPQQDRPLWNPPQKDALQIVRFDFAEAYGWTGEARLLPHARSLSGDKRRSTAPILEAPPREFLPCEVLEFGPARGKKSKALGPGSKTG